MLALLWTVPALAADWREQPWLTAAPADLLAAAAASSKGGSIDMLVDETVVHVYPDGRREERQRRVFEVVTREGAEWYGTYGTSWAAWYQDRPVLDARVITPDGVVHPLRTADIAEGIESGDELVLSDVHTLLAPLPALAPGAVVEETTLVREHAPFLTEGAVRTYALEGGYPDAHVTYEIEVEDGAPFTWKVDSSPIVPLETRSKGLRTLAFAYDVPPLKKPDPTNPDADDDEDDDPTGIHELGKPPDVRPPSFAFSTAKSWQALAAAYGRIVDAQLEGADLAAEAAAARGDAKDTRTIVARLLAHVRRTRYVGIEFGRGAIVPSRPADVAQRGYGDCKDKATLLVGLLRASGVDAHVALLRTGPGADVPTLPGLDLFDHAIVHIGGKDELFVDPTSDFAEVGDLPWQDQGRLALIAAPSTKALHLTPIVPASTNTASITRTVTLSPRGKASVVVDETYSGWPEQYTRERLEGGDPARLAERFQHDATDVYGGKVATDVHTTDPHDLDTPFALHFRVDDATYGATENGQAVARFDVWDELLDRMPGWLLELPEDPKARPRIHDYVFAGYHAESEQIVIPPPEFVPADLPAPLTLAAGPVTLSLRYEVRADGAIVAHGSFDSGPGLLTAEQVALVPRSFDPTMQAQMPLLVFEDRGAVAFREQRVGDALAVYKARYEATPTDPGALEGWARALVQAGFAAPARPLVAEAVRLAPNDRTMLTRQAYVALCDADGRVGHVPGDRATARTAAEAAIALDPKERTAYLLLAAADEVGDDGELFGTGTEPNRAVDALLRYRKATDLHDMDSAIARYEMRLDRWDDLATFVDQMDAGAPRNSAKVALAAIRGGSAAGITEAGRISDLATRRTALNDAGDELLRHRRYKDAAALLDAAAPGMQNPMAARDRARLIGTTVRFEDVTLAPDDPAATADALMIAVFRRDTAATLALASKALLETADDDDEDGIIPDVFSLGANPNQVPRDVLIDLTLSVIDATAEGSAATGWRVRLTNSTTGQLTNTLFVVKEKGGTKIRAFGGDTSELGIEALRRLDSGDVAGAKLWLSWAHDLVGPAAADPFGGALLAQAWRDTDDKHVLRALAAMSAVDSKARAEEALKVLTREAAETTDPALSLQIERARYFALARLDRHAEAEAVAKTLADAHPDSALAADMWARAALFAGHVDTARTAARARFEAHPTDPVSIRTYGDVSEWAGDAPEMLRAYKALFAMGAGTGRDYNNVAWSLAIDPALAAQSVDLAAQANQLDGWRDQAALHTLAVALLETGRPSEAREVLLKALDLPGADAESEAWNYLRARLAEVWGLPAVAQELYASIPAPDADAPPSSLRALAARHRTP